MERKAEKELEQWKKSRGRRPLILYGARQVGKTWLAMHFGKKHYRQLAYFNLEGRPELRDIFERQLSPKIILTQLSALSGMRITPGDTLIFFDEVQAAPKALTSLKYFCEEAPEYHVIAAGSLLGVVLEREKYSFPVGKVQSLDLFPLDFEEFLEAIGEELFAGLIREAYAADRPLSSALHEKGESLYRIYLLTGGMPSCVAEYAKMRDLAAVRAIQTELLRNYTADMAKYATRMETVRNERVFASVPAQLGKENRKFQYKILGSNARAREYDASVDWLVKSGIVLMCTKVTEGRVPLEFYKEPTSFKIYMADTGLLSSRLALNEEAFLAGIPIAGGAQGALAENFLAQALAASSLPLYYWEHASRAEIDFLLQGKDQIVPVECKASDHVRSRSLAAFMKKYDIQRAIRVSSRNFGFENSIKSVPHYAAFCIGEEFAR